MLRLAIQSLGSRLTAVALTILTIAISVALLMGVQLARTSARDSFEGTLSGTDLVVGARTGDVNLLLLSVFGIGSANANVSWATFQKVARHPDVEWTVPISLGDTHRGFRLLGTNPDYFIHFRFNDGQSLRFAAGQPFQDLFDAVVGSRVAQDLHYRLDDRITLSHGTGRVSFADHSDKPFRIVGILAPTGTPVDRAVHVSLEAITAIHADWQGGAPAPRSARLTPEEVRARDLSPESVTAFLVGMRSRAQALTMQRALNTYPSEPLTAVLPGVALSELWSLVGTADRALMAVSGFVVVAGLFGLMTSLLAGLNERRREMAVLRAVGAGPAQIFGLLVFEAGLLSLAGAMLGVAVAYLLLWLLQPVMSAHLGLDLAIRLPRSGELLILCGIVAAGLAVGLVPAWRAYRSSLADGLQPRI